ncbi:uncharacterized protein DS421_3g75050 [Arachis hypogaea]|nr:uncharacterized protein DS421_3g75050 [Arachis hypogaea]
MLTKTIRVPLVVTSNGGYGGGDVSRQPNGDRSHTGVNQRHEWWRWCPRRWLNGSAGSSQLVRVQARSLLSHLGSTGTRALGNGDTDLSSPGLLLGFWSSSVMACSRSDNRFGGGIGSAAAGSDAMMAG